MALINFNTALHLDKGLLPSTGLPNPSDALPLSMDKLVPANMSYMAQVDQIYKGPGVDSSLNVWAQPLVDKPELLEPTRFSDTLSQTIPQIQLLIAKANPQDAATLTRFKYALEDTVSHRDLVRQMQLALFEG